MKVMMNLKLMSAKFFFFWSAAGTGSAVLVSMVVVMMVSLLRLRVWRHNHLRLVPNLLRWPEPWPVSGPARARRVTSASTEVMQWRWLWRFPKERTKSGRINQPILLFEQTAVVIIVTAAAVAAVIAVCHQSSSFLLRRLPSLTLTLVHCLPSSEVVLKRGTYKNFDYKLLLYKKLYLYLGQSIVRNLFKCIIWPSVFSPNCEWLQIHKV